MRGPGGFTVEPWAVAAGGFLPDALALRGSVLALSNGYLGCRGTLDEGSPAGQPGTYLAGFFESSPHDYAERAYGYPETNECILGAPDGTLIRLLVDDEPLDLATGTIHHHVQRLDLRAGILDRETEWSSRTGRRVRVRSRRLVSLTHRAVLAVRYTVEAVGRRVPVVVQSEILAGERSARAEGGAGSDRLGLPLEPLGHDQLAGSVRLLHRARGSGLVLASAMRTTVAGGLPVRLDVGENLGRATVAEELGAGETLELTKYVAYAWSGERTPDALSDEADAALAAAEAAGWDAVVADQRESLDQLWEDCDVRVEGDDEVQQAVRFALFQVVTGAARTEGSPLPAKGLTGRGYEGHAFWETEISVVPVLALTNPSAARDLLRWRHATLPHALDRARELRLAGASFPWRTIGGAECSGYWPASTAAFHLNAAIADAVLRYVRVTGDEEFARREGLDLLVETARLWMALGRTDDAGGFHIDGVTGPDEYSALVDDNVYTNLMARQNLLGAAAAASLFSAEAAERGVDEDEVLRWRRAAEGMTVLYDEERGLHPHSARSLEHAWWDFESTPADRYPLQEHFPYLELYRTQVAKQADVVLAIQHLPDAFTAEQKARGFAYYEGLTVRDSSLSPSTQAIVAAEVGQLVLAHEYVRESARMSLDDLHEDTADGLHLAALAGTWNALVAGFGGLRCEEGPLRLAPRLPDAITALEFGLRTRGSVLRVAVGHDEVRYVWRGDAPLSVLHHGEPHELRSGTPLALPIPGLGDPGPQPRQPRHRDPGSVRRQRLAKSG